ncbi:MAG: RNHCP domain-containing protein [Proteobacteria bacterium]|uniref:RNHCP domain-containing protein n=1 Tax=Candidatus Enterousia avistercoris TaxID=2840788 RepID=A0A9D9DF95_9PROT|nr:RNHCP domain-containing protein [Candidatus Enterousia avistercoris]
MIMKKFTRKIENFVCANCGAHVSGNGYTNHCPNCLWSRHVDNNPGDRNSDCGGMMQPIQMEKSGDGFVITHKCEKCGKVIRQHAAPDDNIDAIIALSVDNSFIFGKKSPK